MIQTSLLRFTIRSRIKTRNSKKSSCVTDPLLRGGHFWKLSGTIAHAELNQQSQPLIYTPYNLSYIRASENSYAKLSNYTTPKNSPGHRARNTNTDIRCLKFRQYVLIIFVKFNKDSSCEMLYRDVNFNIQQKVR